MANDHRVLSADPVVNTQPQVPDHSLDSWVFLPNTGKQRPSYEANARPDPVPIRADSMSLPYFHDLETPEGQTMDKKYETQVGE